MDENNIKINKFKGVSKAVYIIAKIMQVLAIICAVTLAVSMIFVPLLVNNIDFNELLSKVDQQYSTIVLDFINSYTNTQLIIYVELIILFSAIMCFMTSLINGKINKLFKNIYDKETPFIEENIVDTFSIARLMTANIMIQVAFSLICNMFLTKSSNMSLDISFSQLSINLIAYVAVYIFNYGYQMQQK